METIRVGDLKNGMVLAEDVHDMYGRRLLTAGSVINEKNLDILKTWGISDVAVTIESKIAVGTQGQEEAEPVPEESLELFSTVDRNDPLMREIWRQSLSIRSKRSYDRFLRNTKEAAPPQRNSLPSSPAAIVEMGEYSTLPEIYNYILTVIYDERSSAIDISDAITKDPSFTSRLLKLANSSFYALKNSVDTVSKAVSIIGTRQLGTLALGISISRSFFITGENDASLTEFWRHSIATAIAARTLAIFLKEKNTERYFIGGLLHDIGKLLLYTRLHDAVYYIDAICRSHSINQCTAERSILGFTHADVGRALCQKLNLPENLLAMITDHHSVAESLRPFEATVIHFADIIVNGIKKGSSGELFVPPLQDAAREYLVLKPAAIDAVVRQVETHSEEITEIMLHD
ncbi:HDOD domain-containing protein [Marispirochaeta sp.]|uniref:HDOD domain-containing protein n=1 Tax=Marispirochaeta sp. TaxID=2038653 RepID=UPI0029C8B265|nr:HDOD domain-containing protein [Marispirochaeta sp.]